MKGLIFLGLLLLGASAQVLMETSSSIILSQEQGLAQSEVPLVHEEGESDFELFSRFMELEAEAKPKVAQRAKTTPSKANDPVLTKLRKLSRKFITDLSKGLRVTFDKDFNKLAASHDKKFMGVFYAKCRGVAPSPQMCNNILVLYREGFYKQNPFAKKNTGRFAAAIVDILLRYVKAWRKAKNQPKGNPFASVPEGQDPFKGIRIKTDVNGHLNRFGRVNNKLSVENSKSANSVKADGKDNTDDNGVWKSDRAIKDLAMQLRKDLRLLRPEVIKALGRGRWSYQLTSKRTRQQAVERVVAVCRNLKQNQNVDFAPTFCKSIGFLMQVNFVGKNIFDGKLIDKFASVLAAFMQHNHRHAVRGGDIKVARRANYAQDTIAITVNLKLRVTPNRFNLRSVAKEFVNVLASILRVPEQRIRVTAVSLPRVRITFEFLPARNDKETNSNPTSPDSIDSLAAMFRGMAKDKTSDFYKSPVLSRILPRSITMSKLLGVGPQKAAEIKKMKKAAAKGKGQPALAGKKGKGKPRFSEETEESEVEAGLPAVGDNVAELQTELEQISQQEQAEDLLTEEEEDAASMESDEEMEEDVENPDAQPASEEEVESNSASFIEALASEEEDQAKLTEFNIDIPSESVSDYESDEWLSFIATRSEEFVTAEQEGDAEDTDSEEEADAEEEELAAEAETESFEESEIPESAFLEEEAEL